MICFFTLHIHELLLSLLFLFIWSCTFVVKRTRSFNCHLGLVFVLLKVHTIKIWSWTYLQKFIMFIRLWCARQWGFSSWKLLTLLIAMQQEEHQSASSGNISNSYFNSFTLMWISICYTEWIRTVISNPMCILVFIWFLLVSFTLFWCVSFCSPCTWQVGP